MACQTNLENTFFILQSVTNYIILWDFWSATRCRKSSGVILIIPPRGGLTHLKVFRSGFCKSGAKYTFSQALFILWNKILG